MTKYDMRMAERKTSDEETWEIFESAEYATVSTVDADGTPYGTPVSFVLMDGIFYLHTTNTFGHKMDNFARDARVCISAAVDVEPCYEEAFMTSRFGSIVAFGRARLVQDNVERRKMLVALCMKYLPEFKHEIGGAIERELNDTAIWAVNIDEITGKAGRRLSK